MAAILDAAVELLGDRPDASMADVAAAAGVVRQTVYAHYDSRAALLSAVAARALVRTLAAIAAAELDSGPPEHALERLIDAWWQSVLPHARVLETLRSDPDTVTDVHGFHAPVLSQLERLVRRGQLSGAFDAQLPAGWVSASFLALMHTAADEVASGRLPADDAARALRRSVMRLFGLTV